MGTEDGSTMGTEDGSSSALEENAVESQPPPPPPFSWDTSVADDEILERLRARALTVVTHSATPRGDGTRPHPL